MAERTGQELQQQDSRNHEVPDGRQPHNLRVRVDMMEVKLRVVDGDSSSQNAGLAAGLARFTGVNGLFIVKTGWICSSELIEFMSYSSWCQNDCLDIRDSCCIRKTEQPSFL